MTSKNLLKELQQSCVREIAKDIWLVEGYLGDDFFNTAPSSNNYIMRDGDALYIVDTGYYPLYRARMLEIINRYKKEGVKRVVLLLTQGHFDHASNNVILQECGLPWEFLLPEPEVKTINFVNDFNQDIARLAEFEDVFTTMFPMKGITMAIRAANAVSSTLAENILHLSVRKIMGGIQTLADKATILSLDKRVTKRYGNTELIGWEVGRFFVIHDAAHTAGHISIYDPENKMLLTGDVTIEINPAFFYSSIDKLIQTSRAFANMTKEGFVELVADSHRSKTFTSRLYEKYNINPLHATQMADEIRGKKDCEAFLSTFHDYYSDLKKGVGEAHAKVGAAEVKDIVEELTASPNAAVQFKKALFFPNFPSRMDVLVAGILKEAGVRPRREGKKIILSPQGK
jgi:glyoxylase-like metal-dependent hydrolase (beta-lactamase superfamily II)